MGRKGKSAPAKAAWKKPVAGILLGGFSLPLLLGLSSYRPRAAAGNWAGPVGHGIAGALLETAGVAGLSVAGGGLALKGGALAIAKARTAAVGDEPIEADGDARIVLPPSPAKKAQALALARAAAEEPLEDPREPVPPNGKRQTP